MSKRIVVLGGAESGTGAAVLAKLQGFDVFLSDMSNIAPAFVNTLNDYGIAFEQGQHTADLICNATEIIKSPGIPNKAPIIQQIIALQIPIISEIEFASRYTNAKMIAITGTNGKTTTTLLTYHLLKNAGLNVGLAGNIGNSFAMQVATKKFDYYVLELSSFMLDDMFHFKADIAILTNITPDHLDRYGYRMENYVKSKMRLVRNMDQRSALVWCSDDAYSRQGLDQLEQKPFQTYTVSWKRSSSFGGGAYTLDSQLQLEINDELMSIPLNELALVGRHNAYNSMAAAVVAQLMEVRKESIRESLTNFDQLEHRLEKVGRIRGVDYINDSKATNVNSTWYALESMDKPVLWIAGGVDKGNDYTALYDLVASKVKVLICMGKDNRALHEAFAGKVPVIVNVSGMQECVQRAYQLAQKGDAVLLSPACASFDFFENYEDRGRQFKYFVNQL